MGKSLDIVAEFPGIFIIHQKIPGYEVGRHQHSDHEFFLPLQGEISVQYWNEEVKAGPGRMLYVPPNIDHSFASSSQGSGERMLWLIDHRLWKAQVKAKFLPSVFPINSLAKELLFYLLIHRNLKGTRYFISALIETLSESLQAVQLQPDFHSLVHISGRVVDERIKKSIEIIESKINFVTLSDVPKQSGMSVRNFNRLFLLETGITPKNFLILRRIERAKELLQNTKLTITDISLEVGYNSLSKFIATFKKITGILPSDYRSTS